jgi:hypothetical protein
MATLEKHAIDAPDETRNFKAHGHVDVVTLGDFTIGKEIFEPGWRWSDDVKPIAGTEMCMVHHTGVCVSGHMTIHHQDGTELAVGPGDVFDLQPGHDAWVDGAEPCVMWDTGVKPYAKPAG